MKFIRRGFIETTCRMGPASIDSKFPQEIDHENSVLRHRRSSDFRCHISGRANHRNSTHLYWEQQHPDCTGTAAGNRNGHQRSNGLKCSRHPWASHKHKRGNLWFMGGCIKQPGNGSSRRIECHNWRRGRSWHFSRIAGWYGRR
jgi:hypothetical protein